MTLRGCTSASGIQPQSLLMTEHACSDSCVQAETRVLLWHASERDIDWSDIKRDFWLGGPAVIIL